MTKLVLKSANNISSNLFTGCHTGIVSARPPLLGTRRLRGTLTGAAQIRTRGTRCTGGIFGLSK